MQYNDGYGEQLFSFVNNINTTEGGTHVSGFKSALTKVCNKRAQEFQILKGESFSSEDVREGLVCVISVKVPEPQFEGQTKTNWAIVKLKVLLIHGHLVFLIPILKKILQLFVKFYKKLKLQNVLVKLQKKPVILTRRKTVLESSVFRAN